MLSCDWLTPTLWPASHIISQCDNLLVRTGPIILTSYQPSARAGLKNGWPEVVEVRTEGQYSPVRSRACSLCSLLGTFRSEYDYEYESVVLSTWKNFNLRTHCACSVRKTCTLSRRRTPIWRSLLYGTEFLIVLVANFELLGFAPKQKYANWTVFTKTVRTAKSRPKKNQSERSDLRKTGFAI